MNKLLLELHAQSGSIVPITKKKQSVEGWNKFQTTAATQNEIEEWVASGVYEGFGLMMGYGDFHVIDVDTKNAPEDQKGKLFQQIWTDIPDPIKSKLIIQRTRNGGEHIIYKSPALTVSEKLVLNPSNNKIMIETIGSNNYILIEPSPGYEVVSGSFSNVSHVSVEDHDWLLKHCRTIGTSIVGLPSFGDSVNAQLSIQNKNDFIRSTASYLESTDIDITNDYDDWIRIGYGIANEKSESGREYFHQISANHPDYKFKLTNNVYDSILHGNTTGKKATGASLRYVMKKHGIEISTEDDNKTASKTKKSIEYITSKGLHRNLFSNKVEKKNGQLISDSDIDDFYLELRSAGISISKTDVASVVNSSNVPGVNPVKEWLQYSEFYADDKAIDELMSCLELKETNPELVLFYKSLVLKWLLQFPAVIMDKVLPRLVLVIIGETYIGKTQFFRRLLPSDLDHYYAESSLDRDKDSEILMTEHLMINVDELAGIMKSSKNVERFKAYSSSQYFTLRTPYGKINERFERKAILCGTSNRADIVQDHDTGNSRLIPLELISIDWDRFNAIDRRALFGSLLKLYIEIGEVGLQLTPDDREKLKQQSGEYTALNIEQELIQRFIYPAEATEENFKTVSEICDFLTSKTEQNFDPNKLSRELNKQGFIKGRKRKTGRKSPLYGFYVSYDDDILGMEVE